MNCGRWHGRYRPVLPAHLEMALPLVLLEVLLLLKGLVRAARVGLGVHRVVGGTPLVALNRLHGEVEVVTFQIFLYIVLLHQALS